MSSPFSPLHGGPHLVDHHSHQPAWKRLHRSSFFWVAALFIMAGIVTYIMTGNLSTMPGKSAQQPVPALTP